MWIHVTFAVKTNWLYQKFDLSPRPHHEVWISRSQVQLTQYFCVKTETVFETWLHCPWVSHTWLSLGTIFCLLYQSTCTAYQLFHVSHAVTENRVWCWGKNFYKWCVPVVFLAVKIKTFTGTPRVFYRVSVADKVFNHSLPYCYWNSLSLSARSDSIQQRFPLCQV